MFGSMYIPSMIAMLVAARFPVAAAMLYLSMSCCCWQRASICSSGAVASTKGQTVSCSNIAAKMKNEAASIEKTPA